VDAWGVVKILIGLCAFLASYVLRTFDKRLSDVEDAQDEATNAIIRIEARQVLLRTPHKASKAID
jgi:hypothetical protein